MRNAFNLKDSNYPITMRRTKKEHNAFKTLLKEKKKLEQKDMSGE